MNRSFFDLIHPEDKEKIKDQLDVYISKNSRIIDLKSKTIFYPSF